MRSYTDFPSLSTNAMIHLIGAQLDEYSLDGVETLTGMWHGPSWGLAPLDVLTTMGPLKKRWRIGTKRQIPNTDFWVRLVTYTYGPSFLVYVIQAEGWRQWPVLVGYFIRGFAGNIVQRILWTLVVWGLAKRQECMIPHWRDVAIIGRFFRD